MINTNKTKEQFIKNDEGKIEYVILPIAKYQEMMDAIEDYGLSKAMEEAETDAEFTREEAIKSLEI
jgi:hypothetical protein